MGVGVGVGCGGGEEKVDYSCRDRGGFNVCWLVDFY